LENGVIIKQCTQPSLIIDPSMRALNWLRQHLQGQSSKVEVVNQSDANFVTQVELAVRFGKTLLVQETSRLDPSLYALVRGDRIVQGARSIVYIGEKQVDYSDAFRIYFATRDASLVLPPTAASILTLVNFTTTRAGLTSQVRFI
jgi:dynein heavy chain 2